MFAASDRLSEAFDELKENLKKPKDEGGDDREPIKAPKDLEDKVNALLKQHPHITWHHAIKSIIDPDTLVDEDEEDGEQDLDDDEDLSDIDE